MSLLQYEWRKLARTPALWGFLALCLAFNGLLLFASGWTRQEFNAGSAIAAQLGQRVDDAFLAGVAEMPQSEARDDLLETLQQVENVLLRYDAGALDGPFRDVLLQECPWAAALMSRKMEKAASQAAHLAETGAALDFYAGPITDEANGFLYRIYFKALLTEGILLGILSMLCLMDHERTNRTTAAVCVSRTGRRLWRTKVLAGVTAALALYLLLAFITFAAYFALWDYGGVWNASIASGFNSGIWENSDMQQNTYRSYLPWLDFHAAGYLLTVVALGAGLTAVFTLLAAVCGTLLANAYAAALVLAVLVTGSWAVWYTSYMNGCWSVFVPLSFLPTSLWDQTVGWFTDGGILYITPWQETLTTVLWLALGGAGTALALRRFYRKDVQI